MIEKFKQGDTVLYNGKGHTLRFSCDKEYIVSLVEDTLVRVIEDDLGFSNGMHPKYFIKKEFSFESWWEKYYPQEYGHNSEFRTIVERHARRAFEAGKTNA